MVINSTRSPLRELILLHRSINASDIADVLPSVRTGPEWHLAGTSGNSSSLTSHVRGGNASEEVTESPRDPFLRPLADGLPDATSLPPQEVVFMSSLPSTSLGAASSDSGGVITSILPFFSSESSSNMTSSSSSATHSASSAPPNLSLYSCLEYLTSASPSASSSASAYVGISPSPNASHVWCNTTSGLGRTDLLGAGQEVKFEGGDETFLFDRGDVRGVLIALYTLVFISGFVGE